MKTQAKVSKNVTLVEVGLRDGLQNESIVLSQKVRLELAQKLVAAGARRLELGAFVRSDKVPQMQGSFELIQKFYEDLPAEMRRKLRTSALVPNLHGWQEAQQTQLSEIAVFASASETFSHKNINCSIDESFVRFAPVIKAARARGLKVRGYLSCCFGCPYEGKVSQQKVIQLAKRLRKIGCEEISIGDTIGVATPGQVQKMFTALLSAFSAFELAGHFHDTRGTAMANIWASYELDLRTFDTSLGGLGGCPYAPGSAGNVATEDVVYLFEQSGIKTGLNLPMLLQTHDWLSKTMKKELDSKMGKAGILRPLASRL